MHKLMEVAAAAALLAGAAGPAAAQDWNGAEQIGRGDYAAAERLILKQQRMFSGDVDLMINLAAVYARTGRTAEARRLYQTVAARPDEKMDMAGQRTAWSQALAAEGLRRLDRQVAALR